MQHLISKINDSYKKAKVVPVKSGDTVKVHQKIKEGNKERIQIFQGLVIRTSKKNSHTARILVRRMTSGIGVEKSFLIHSPLVTKIEVSKRSKVRRNYLSYMRRRSGKSARLSSVEFDKDAINAVEDETAKEEEEKLRKQQVEEAAKKAEEKKQEEDKLAAKAAAVEARHKDK